MLPHVCRSSWQVVAAAVQPTVILPEQRLKWHCLSTPNKTCWVLIRVGPGALVASAHVNTQPVQWSLWA